MEGWYAGDVIICFCVCFWCGDIVCDQLMSDSVVYDCFHHEEDMECFFVREYSLVFEQVFDFFNNGEGVCLDSY